jgi:tripeptidyl-peptidase I
MCIDVKLCIELQGKNIVIYITPQGGTQQSYHYGGSSASSAVAASVFALVNAQLAANNKGLIGNPRNAFYTASPSMFRDVVSGNNDLSGAGAWPAAPGWDPATGLGTPLYDRILGYYMNH